jgi:hypothetical protein
LTFSLSNISTQSQLFSNILVPPNFSSLPPICALINSSSQLLYLCIDARLYLLTQEHSKRCLFSSQDNHCWPIYRSQILPLHIVKEEWSFPWSWTDSLLFDLSYYSIHKENRHMCTCTRKRANDQERWRARQ